VRDSVYESVCVRERECESVCVRERDLVPPARSRAVDV